jgi:hypothetical protein
MIPPPPGPLFLMVCERNGISESGQNYLPAKDSSNRETHSFFAAKYRLGGDVGPDSRRLFLKWNK